MQKGVNQPGPERPDVPSSHLAMGNRDFIYATVHRPDEIVRCLNAVFKACGIMEHHGIADFFLDCSSWSPHFELTNAYAMTIVRPRCGWVVSRIPFFGRLQDKVENHRRFSQSCLQLFKRYDGGCFCSSSIFCPATPVSGSQWYRSYCASSDAFTNRKA